MEKLPLRAALEAVGLTFCAFQHLEKRNDISALLAALGVDLQDHIPEKPRGPRAGHGCPRFVSRDGLTMVAIALRLGSLHVKPADALRIAAAFTFLGEMGNGLRAIVPADQAAMRAPGETFPADLGVTFLLVIPARLDAPEAPAVAIVPARDLTARNLLDWAGENDADAETAVLLNLSAIVAQIAAITPGKS